MRIRILRFPEPALLAGFALAAGAAAAQDYPNRPIRLIIPYGTGGITDITARIIAPRMSDNLGQQLVVENRPGGAAIPGFDLVAKGRPGGYIAVLATTALAANPILFRKLPYDAEKDLAPVSLVATAPTVMVVHPSIPVHSVKELIALAKSRPGALNYGSAGNGSVNHLTIIDRLRAELVKALQNPEVVERAKELGAEPVGSTPREAAAFLKNEIARWARVSKEAHIPLVD